MFEILKSWSKLIELENSFLTLRRVNLKYLFITEIAKNMDFQNITIDAASTVWFIYLMIHSQLNAFLGC